MFQLSLKRQFWFSGPNLSKKGIFSLKKYESLHGLGNGSYVETYHDEFLQDFPGKCDQKNLDILKSTSL